MHYGVSALEKRFPPRRPRALSHPLDNLGAMVIALDLDGVLCDLGPGVAARIADRFRVATHPSTWRTYDLRLLRLGVPERSLTAFLDEMFDDPELYEQGALHDGAGHGVRQLREAGWTLVGVTARPAHLAAVTLAWLARHALPLDGVHHTRVGAKAGVARRLGAVAAIEDNPVEAELLGAVCDSWLLDRPYNRDFSLRDARRLRSWDDAVGRLCQLRLFA
jgi:uncharacterized HAD superfamily protein